SVIGGFGVLSFLQGMSISNNIYYSIGIAAAIMAGVFIFFFSNIWYNALDEAEEAIEGDQAVAFV
ncbi:MAG TPA: hypothetical protein PKD95_02225, partial [Candidatus Paceibacterota bacterium]|nr:hypothetical protein [Candidatus Paceibacterota bacterium]